MRSESRRVGDEERAVRAFHHDHAMAALPYVAAEPLKDAHELGSDEGGKCKHLEEGVAQATSHVRDAMRNRPAARVGRRDAAAISAVQAWMAPAVSARSRPLRVTWPSRDGMAGARLFSHRSALGQ